MTKSFLSKYWGALILLAVSQVGIYVWWTSGPNRLHAIEVHSDKYRGGSILKGSRHGGLFLDSGPSSRTPVTLSRTSKASPGIVQSQDPAAPFGAKSQSASRNRASDILRRCVDAFESPDSGVRLAAVLTLKRLGSPQAIPLLEQASRKEHSRNVHKEMLLAIRHLERQKVAPSSIGPEVEFTSRKLPPTTP